MALEIPAGFGQVLYRFSLVSDPEEIITTVGVDMSTLAPDPDTAAADLADGFTSGFGAAEYSDQWSFNGVTLRVGNGTPTPDVYTNTNIVQGTFAGQTLPQNCTMLIRKLSSVGGRRGRGRMYMPPINLWDTNVSATGVIDPSYLAGAQANIDQWLGATFGYVLLHSSGLSATPPPTPITSFVLDPRIATQRRRLRP